MRAVTREDASSLEWLYVARLLDECCVEGSGRATRADRALRKDVTLKRMQQCD